MTTFALNPPAPGVPYYTPAQYPPAGTALPNKGKALPKLFQPIKIRGVEFPNRIWVAPLSQYSADNGRVTAWHMAHLGGIFTRGPGFTMAEAAAVLPEGRITPEDAGLWNDEHMVAWREIVQFAHSQGQKIGIQLAHAGRKASTLAPWVNMAQVAQEWAGGWLDEVVAASAIPFSDQFPHPKELTEDGIRRTIAAFVAAARRAVQAGFDVVEVHAAHGYLIGGFLSPVANKRTDKYGGSFENRTRLLVEIVDAIRATIPPSMPLFVRVSATDCLEESLPEEHSWRVEDSERLAGILADHGVDLLDVSSGGTHPKQSIRSVPGYQVPFSEQVKKHNGDKILVGAVGKIFTATFAEEVLASGKADVIFVGRGFQKNTGLVWSWAEELGVTITVARQIEWGWIGRGAVGRRGASAGAAF